MAIIYKATFVNNKAYVGYTTKKLKDRAKEHLISASNGSPFLFHKAIRKYGEPVWEILEENTDEEKLLYISENYHIVKNRTHFTENGYNMTWGGEAGSNEYWKNTLTEEQWEEHLEQIKNNLSKTWNSEIRFEAIKKSWKCEKRKQQASDRMKERWSNIDRNEIGNKISESLKEARKLGKYSNEKEHLREITERARVAIKGTKWYNDGVKNYRLNPNDPKASLLSKGKI